MRLEPAPRFGPDTPAAGEAVEVARGVLWLRFPLPFALDHVNLWALDDDGGWTIVDTGFADAVSEALWLELLDGPLRAQPIKRLIVTHYHPDHMGLAGWLQARTGAPLWMPEPEWLMARLLHADAGPEALRTALSFYAKAGLDPSKLQALEADGNVYARRVSPPPKTFLPLREGDALEIGGRRFEVLLGEGHAPAQACLYAPEDGLLLAADQILPRISPNIPVWPQTPDADPLGRFAKSLDKLRTLPAETRVLPSHDWPFEDLHGRIDGLKAFHDRRLVETLEAARSGATAAAVLRRLFPKVADIHQVRFALGETLSHLNRLVATGDLARTLEGDHWHFVQAH